jgi:uncharacterized protein (TIGR03032 family)
VAFRYTQTDSFVDLLQQLGASVLVTTYQANKLLVVRAAQGGLSTLVRTFERPMGLAVDARGMALGTRDQIWFLRNAPDIAPRIEPAGVHDACYLPRSCHVTGDIGVHEMAWGGGARPFSRPCHEDGGRIDDPSHELWIVNTRFSCLCTLDPDYSFVPRWRPPFITALAAEDRCHLNGLAMGHDSDPTPRYVTALGDTDTAGDWRANKALGGILMDIPSGEIVARGLCMPHSPRLNGGRLWLLESGTGQLALIDPASGRRQAVAELPGFARGLAFAGPYAFVGLSKIRPSSAMDGVPLAQRRDKLKCGVAVVDLRSGQPIAFLEFQTAVEEIFDVQVVCGLRFPEVVGFQKEAVHHTFIVPATGQPSRNQESLQTSSPRRASLPGDVSISLVETPSGARPAGATANTLSLCAKPRHVAAGQPAPMAP